MNLMNSSASAMIVIPQWNGDAISHNAFSRLFRLFGVSTLRLSMPYHDIRMPAELHRADYSVSANLGRTIHAHPTLPEMVMEAAEDTAGKALHKVGRSTQRKPAAK